MKSNFFTVSGWIIGLLSFVTAIFLYSLGKKEKEPAFIVDPIRFELLSAKNIQGAPIRILTNSGDEITKDVSSAIIYFWNKGREPIKKQDILEDIIIELDGEAKVLETKLLKTSRGVCKIGLDIFKDNKIKVDFDILEQNDGFSAQIIYLGSTNVDFKLSQTIIGVRKVSNFTASGYDLFFRILRNLLLGITILIGFLFLNFVSSSKSKDYESVSESMRFKKKPEYEVNSDYRHLVDRFTNLEEQENELKYEIEKIIAIQKPDSPESKGAKWKAIGVTALIIVIISSISYLVYYTVQEIDENPSKFIPTELHLGN